MPEHFELSRNPLGQLVYRSAQGAVHTAVVPVRAFPLAAPDEGLSIVSAEGRELLWVERLVALPAPARALVDEELAAREFVPEILQLSAVSTFSTPSVWSVQTDRGATQFILKTEEDIRRLDRTGLLIASGQGVQYLVRDKNALDRASRKLLDRFL